MYINFLYNILDDSSKIKNLIDKLGDTSTYNEQIHFLEAAKPFFFALLHIRLNYPILLITSTMAEADKLFLDVNNWLQSNNSIYLLPPRNDIYKTGNNNISDIAIRPTMMTLLNSKPVKNELKNKNILLISPIQAVLEKTMSIHDFNNYKCRLEKDMNIDPAILEKKWYQIGYEPEEMVEIPGTFCRRGGILDIYPLNNDLPIRVEFLGDKIESIRSFDPKTQKSISNINTILIAPFDDKTMVNGGSSILDYFPKNSIIIFNDKNAVIDKINDINNPQILECIGQLSQESYVQSDNSLTFDQFKAKINEYDKQLDICLFDGTSINNFESSLFSVVPKFGGQIDYFVREISLRVNSGCLVVMISQQVERLYELLNNSGIACSIYSELNDNLQNNTVLIKGSLSEGWSVKDRLIIYTDNEIFGFTRKRRRVGKNLVKHHLYLDQINIGDYIVHIDHGIGKFIGLKKLETKDNQTEYLVIEYASNDKLYVPIHQIDRISRYIGGTEQKPSLSRLNTQDWTLIKLRIKKAIKAVADELLKLYALRQTISGFAFSQDSIWQMELESSFPYEETEDQLVVLKEVKTDMESDKPMDRLICGDVGYGKTEIALRAAFKAVMDNKQVVILAPTTVLAQQHYNTFSERLRAFPINVAVLSRFCSENEQKEIINGLLSGTIDICIATHRILQKDIIVKNLGLLIIDEEQRFGVAHKEHFKKLRQEIDILTLSATPIPRTLHMSLSGIKDLSILETPPENRLPIKTMVGPYSSMIVKDAILQELKRGGQIYYIHNRIHDIYEVARRIKDLVPEVKMAVAHGRMTEDSLEGIMLKFVEQEIDLLLTTTIIESGIDIPNANTLIIDDSDRMGLIQLHQLRGRIGRGHNNAYSYLFYKTEKRLSEEAKKRLRIIAEATELGAGFTIAMKDLEIRGAGNLLGIEQSGYIAAIGFDLYNRLLTEAVQDLKNSHDSLPKQAQIIHEIQDTKISLSSAAYIPDYYISNMDARIQLYKRISHSINEQELFGIKDEIKDRFGDMPEEIINLLFLMQLKLIAKNTSITSISELDKKITISFIQNRKLSEIDLSDFRKKYDGLIRIGIYQMKIDLDNMENNWQEFIIKIIKDLKINLN